MRSPTIILFGCLFVCLSGCDVFGDSGLAEDIIVQLSNQDTEVIHIFGPGEGFELGNQLGPGQDREYAIRRDAMTEGAQFRFSAGVNGTVFQTVTCVVRLDDSFEAPTFPSVVYTQAGILDCIAWGDF